jgi:adenylosuccinate synthase
MSIMADNIRQHLKDMDSYISFLEEELECPIKIVSVGPDRDQTIERYND